MSGYQKLKDELGSCRLIGVSKYQSLKAIREVYQEGLRDFGENKVQDLLEKKTQLPDDIHWHMIGHLQRNKVKYIAPFIYMIHSVDSLDLLKEINRQAEHSQRTIPVLLQMHLAQEESKFGLHRTQLIEIMEYYTSPGSFLQNIRIQGLMTMATNTEDRSRIRSEFAQLRNLFQMVKDTYLPHQPDFCELSMGMSSDYHEALQEGSTMVRIGSLLFAPY
ncbi:MAG TPA: YggS family pyridoxal phosphate-dependent enzyme [Chitinophagaceae bacterium]|nr:YggS family pyridoxal phosphate-dependent enzyme [Chitinophagaceae bacterium]